MHVPSGKMRMGSLFGSSHVLLKSPGDGRAVLGLPPLEPDVGRGAGKSPLQKSPGIRYVAGRSDNADRNRLDT